MSINFESHTIDRRSFLKGAGVLGAAGLLSACGGSKSDNGTANSAASGAAQAPNTTGGEPISEYISFESANRELESWNILYTQQSTDANVITNLWDGLLSFDCYGKVAPAIASSWEHNEDSTVWTFHLRDDVDWVDMNGEVKTHLTSKDFLVGFEWVLNAAKNEANNTSSIDCGNRFLMNTRHTCCTSFFKFIPLFHPQPHFHALSGRTTFPAPPISTSFNFSTCSGFSFPGSSRSSFFCRYHHLPSQKPSSVLYFAGMFKSPYFF